jgi:hypothetical protein
MKKGEKGVNGTTMIPVIKIIRTGYDSIRNLNVVRLTIDTLEYEYETSPFHVERFKRIFRSNPITALSYIKGASYSCSRTGRIIVL